MLTIAEDMARTDGYVLTQEARQAIAASLGKSRQSAKVWGNAREARKLLAVIYRAQASRLTGSGEPTALSKAALNTISDQDVSAADSRLMVNVGGSSLHESHDNNQHPNALADRAYRCSSILPSATISNVAKPHVPQISSGRAQTLRDRTRHPMTARRRLPTGIGARKQGIVNAHVIVSLCWEYFSSSIAPRPG